MNNKYFFKNKKLINIMKIIDALGDRIFKPQKINKDFKPEKILVSNVGHLGDMFLSLKIIEILKEKNPKSKIYFLCGSWSLKLIERNPLIEKIVVYEPFFLNSKRNFFIALKSLFSFLKALWKISKIKPDIAFDLRASFPNTLLLLGLSQTKFICGYETVGFGFIADVKIKWREDILELEHYLDVIRGVWEVCDYKKLGKPNVDYLVKDINEDDILKKYNITSNEKYIVFHMFSRDKHKMIDIEKWLKLFDYCSVKYKIVLTGNSNEFEYIEKYFNNKKQTLNLAGKLDIGELILILKKAFFIITVDTFVSQIVSILNLNSIIIFTGGIDVKRFGPVGDKCYVFKKDIFCSPCYWYRRDDCKYECKDIDILSKFIEVEKNIK